MKAWLSLKRNRGLNSAFTVRKISSGVGVERAFQLHSPLIASIEVKRRGDVRRAKLYYLRERSGKSARIKEKLGVRKLQNNSAICPTKKSQVITLGIFSGFSLCLAKNHRIFKTHIIKLSYWYIIDNLSKDKLKKMIEVKMIEASQSLCIPFGARSLSTVVVQRQPPAAVCPSDTLIVQSIGSSVTKSRLNRIGAIGLLCQTNIRIFTKSLEMTASQLVPSVMPWSEHISTAVRSWLVSIMTRFTWAVTTRFGIEVWQTSPKHR